MLAWAAVLLSLCAGAPSPGADRTAFSFRAEGREVAELRSAPLVDAVGSRVVAWRGGAILEPGITPFPAYHPGEWIRTVAGRLGVGDHRLTRAALFVLSVPVQVDVSPRHVRLVLRLAIP